MNKEKSVNEEKSKAGPATRVPYSENQGPLFFSENSYRRTSVKAYLYFLNVFFSEHLAPHLSIIVISGRV